MRNTDVSRVSSSPVIALAVVALILGACGTRTANDQAEAASVVASDSIVAVIEDLVEDYYETMTRRDWPQYEKHFWPGATLTTAWQPPGESSSQVIPTTIEAFIDQTHVGPDSAPIFEEHLLEQEATVRGSIAVVFAKYEARFGSEDSVMSWRGTDAFTWLNHQDEWRIAALVYSNEE